MLSRTWIIPEDQNISELTLSNALADKYGPKSATYAEPRQWDRRGQNLTGGEDIRAKCQKGSVQDIRYSMDHGNGQYNNFVSPYCGPVAEMAITPRPGTASASGLSILMIDPDELWADFWRSWSASEYKENKALLESVAGATDAAPEL